MKKKLIIAFFIFAVVFFSINLRFPPHEVFHGGFITSKKYLLKNKNVDLKAFTKKLKSVDFINILKKKCIDQPYIQDSITKNRIIFFVDKKLYEITYKLPWYTVPPSFIFIEGIRGNEIDDPKIEEEASQANKGSSVFAVKNKISRNVV